MGQHFFFPKKMVKSYQRYEQTASFGIINSFESNAVYDSDGMIAVTPALEDVVLWDIRKGVQASPNNTF
jgi:U3 small nucleolar RNA-associated protein 12